MNQYWIQYRAKIGEDMIDGETAVGRDKPISSPQDRKALSDWIEENATIAKQKEVLQSLATMKDGGAWVWSPRIGIMEQVQIRMRKTFDSSATPKPGEKIKQPKDLASIDLGKLKDKLAASVEKAAQRPVLTMGVL